MPFPVPRHRLLRAPAFRATLGLLVLGCCALAPAAHAQSVWLDRDHGPGGQLEVLFTRTKDLPARFPSATEFLSARLGRGERTHLVLDVPYANVQFNTISGTTRATVSDGTIGNPYVGVEYAARPSGMRYEFGVRVPVVGFAHELAWSSGFVSDIEREEAFLPDLLSVRFAFHAHHPAAAAGRIAWDARAVPTLWVSTQTQSINETEILLGYLGTVRYEGAWARLGGGVTGRYVLVADGSGMGGSNSDQLDLMADFLPGSVRPGVQAKFPLDHDRKDLVNREFGLMVTFQPQNHP